MLILSVQYKKHIQMVYSSGYTPDANRSEYIHLSPQYSFAYNTMASRLYEKDKEGNYNSFWWGWVKNPYLDFYRLKGVRSRVGVFLNIPDDKVIVSDYDLYCDFLEERTKSLHLVDEGDCLQGVFRSINPNNILSVVELKDLIGFYDQGVRSVKSLYSLSYSKDISSYMDVFSLPDYSMKLVSLRA